MLTPPRHHPVLALAYPVALLGSAFLLCAWAVTHEAALPPAADGRVVAELQDP